MQYIPDGGVHYPSNPLQPGPIYVLTLRKCGRLGVCCEAFPKQVTYLVDECVDRANTVISYLYHYLKNYGINAIAVHWNADYCKG
uniref:Uncharacterized protein n=1 Tax=Amphimedon queenslandica TaxID=400682 RepID=A0A1X7T506_AMPQE